MLQVRLDAIHAQTGSASKEKQERGFKPSGIGRKDMAKIVQGEQSASGQQAALVAPMASAEVLNVGTHAVDGPGAQAQTVIQISCPPSRQFGGGRLKTVISTQL